MTFFHDVSLFSAFRLCVNVLSTVWVGGVTDVKVTDGLKLFSGLVMKPVLTW